MGNKQGKAKAAAGSTSAKAQATAASPAPAPSPAVAVAAQAPAPAPAEASTAAAAVAAAIEANGLTHFLSIGLIQGKSLVAADRGLIRSTSDPYVKIILELAGGRTVEQVSKVKKGTLNPVFNQRFDFDCGTAPPVRVRFVVFDWDKLSKHDIIGEGSHDVTAADWGLGRNVDIPLTVTRKDGTPGPAGTLQLQLAGRSVDPAADAPARLRLDYVKALGLMTLRIDEVHGLQPGPIAAKALGADVIASGAYDLRVVIQYGIRNFSSRPVPRKQPARPRPAGEGKGEAEFSWEAALAGRHVIDETCVHMDQQCRIWVREGQEAYLPRVSLYAIPHEAPAAGTDGATTVSKRPGSASVRRMMRVFSRKGGAGGAKGGVPVLLGHGFLTTSVLTDGQGHTFSVYITEPGKHERVTDASSHDIGQSVSTPHVAGASGGAGALPEGGESDTDTDNDEVDEGGASEASLYSDDGSGFKSEETSPLNPAATSATGGGGAAAGGDAPAQQRKAIGLTRQASTTTPGETATATESASAPAVEHVSGLDAYMAHKEEVARGGAAPGALPHVVGRITLDGVFENKDEVERWFYSRLMGEFDGNGSGTLDRTEMLAMLSTLGSTMGEKELTDLFARLDTSGDGQLDGAELLQWLHSPEFQSLPMAYSLLAFLADGRKGLDELVNDVTRFVGSANKDTNAGAGILAIHEGDGSVTLADRGLKIIDRKSGVLMDEHIPGFVGTAINLMYHSTMGSMLTNTGAVRRVLHTMSAREGAKMDKPESASKIAHFIELHNLNTDEMALAVHEYKTFNEFFYRELKPGARPIEDKWDDSVMTSPADCRMVVFPTILDATRIWVKGEAFTVESLLGPECADVAPLFLGGSLCIARLAPQDYHRWHLPVTGRLGRRHKIDGALYTVNPIAIRRNKPDVYTENKREVLLVHTQAFGLVAMVAVGATIVGSINIVLPDGSFGTKGDCHGYFAFGGSTVLVLTQPGTIKFDADLLLNSEQPLETLVRVGDRIGKAVDVLPAHVQGVLPADDAGHIVHRSRAAVETRPAGTATATTTVTAEPAVGGGAAAETPAAPVEMASAPAETPSTPAETPAETPAPAPAPTTEADATPTAAVVADADAAPAPAPASE